MTKRKITVRLGDQNLDFAKRYAAEVGMTVEEILDRYLTRLREGAGERPIQRKVEKLSGLVPADVDARALYYEHLLKKHS